ncbi:MAG: hypothetical protein GWN29_10995, partial [Gammaproteobacteria bacterium]|nr:hypothetical protein [Gammaproteobacteria bacterium]
MLDTAPTNARRCGSRFGILLEHVLTGALVVALAIGLRVALPLSELFTWKVITAVLVGGAVTLSYSTRYLSTSTLGAANLVTLARGGLVTLLAGFIGEMNVGWAAFMIASTVLVLDGVDGW